MKSPSSMSGVTVMQSLSSSSATLRSASTRPSVPGRSSSTALHEFLEVKGGRLQVLANGGGKRRYDDQRQDHPVAAGDFGDQEDAGQGRLQHAADQTGHAQQRKAALVDPVGGRPQGAAAGGGRSTPPGCRSRGKGRNPPDPPAQGEGGGRDFGENEQQRKAEARNENPLDHFPDPVVPLADDDREKKADQAHHRPAAGRPQPQRKRQPGGDAVGASQRPGEQNRSRGGESGQPDGRQAVEQIHGNWRWAKAIWLPCRIRLIWAPATDAIAIGTILRAVHSPRTTSTVNTSPAIGALKIEEIAPAAPQPTRVIRWRSFNLKRRAMEEPMAAPLITTGASGPAEPPLPMVRKLEISRE